ncbi:MAG TPA: hypothetical protein VHR86_07730, partial [Armatimonadota bacterium]|nr:hypothetical protein [Armatimonadota bacterium]
PPKPQAQQPQVSKLAIRLTGCTGLTRIAVQLTPQRANATAPVESITLRPLAEWPGKETGAH